jgi:hypothetical protein
MLDSFINHVIDYGLLKILFNFKIAKDSDDVYREKEDLGNLVAEVYHKCSANMISRLIPSLIRKYTDKADATI